MNQRESYSNITIVSLVLKIWNSCQDVAVARPPGSAALSGDQNVKHAVSLAERRALRLPPLSYVPSRSDFMPFIIENLMHNNSTCPNLKSRFHLKIPRHLSNLAVYQNVNCCIRMIRIFRLKANFVVVKWRYYIHITYLEKNSEKKFLLNG